MCARTNSFKRGTYLAPYLGVFVWSSEVDHLYGKDTVVEYGAQVGLSRVVVDAFHTRSIGALVNMPR